VARIAYQVVDRYVLVSAFLKAYTVGEGGDAGGRGLGRSNPPQCLSETLSVALAMSSATEFAVPKEPKCADFFTAIQAAQDASLPIPLMIIASEVYYFDLFICSERTIFFGN